VVAKVRERLTVNKQTTHRLHVEMFNLGKLKEAEGEEQYQVDIPNWFAALENLTLSYMLIELGKVLKKI
jgi:DNA-binding IclR family transcriptional regulator